MTEDHRQKQNEIRELQQRIDGTRASAQAALERMVDEQSELKRQLESVSERERAVISDVREWNTYGEEIHTLHKDGYIVIDSTVEFRHSRYTNYHIIVGFFLLAMICMHPILRGYESGDPFKVRRYSSFNIRENMTFHQYGKINNFVFYVIFIGNIDLKLCIITSSDSLADPTSAAASDDYETTTPHTIRFLNLVFRCMYEMTYPDAAPQDDSATSATIRRYSHLLGMYRGVIEHFEIVCPLLLNPVDLHWFKSKRKIFNHSD